MKTMFCKNKYIKTVALLSVLAICLQMMIIPTFGVHGLTTAGDNVGIISGRVYHIKAYNGKYFDVANAGTANGTNVQIYNFNVDAACQEWIITQVGTDGSGKLYKIKDVNSGKLLSIEASSSANAANAWVWEDDGTTGQIFKIRQNSDGTFTFLTQCSNYTRALSYDSAMSVRQYTDSTTDNSMHFSISYASLNRYKNYKGVCDGHNLLFNVYYDTVPYYDSSDSNAYVHMSLFKNLNYLPEIYFTYLGQGYYSMRSSINGATYYLTASTSTSPGQKQHGARLFQPQTIINYGKYHIQAAKRHIQSNQRTWYWQEIITVCRPLQVILFKTTFMQRRLSGKFVTTKCIKATICLWVLLTHSTPITTHLG